MHHRHAATTTEVVADIPHMSALTDKQCRQVLMSWGGDGRRLYRGASGDEEGDGHSTEELPMHHRHAATTTEVVADTPHMLH